MQGVYLSLGTNLGNREENLLKAQELLASNGITVSSASSVYETAAWGKEDQGDFLNQVIKVETVLLPQVLLTEINRIEKEMGRVRFEKWGKRVIDIDILYFNNDIIDQVNLKVPHPEIQQRRFILEPMVEIAADGIHPIHEKTQTELLESCVDHLQVKQLVG